MKINGKHLKNLLFSMVCPQCKCDNFIFDIEKDKLFQIKNPAVATFPLLICEKCGYSFHSPDIREKELAKIGIKYKIIDISNVSEEEQE